MARSISPAGVPSNRVSLPSDFYREEFIKCQRCLEQQREFYSEGTIDEVHHDDVSRTTKGEKVTRHGSADNPAYVIRQDDGTVVLKLASEVERA